MLEKALPPYLPRSLEYTEHTENLPEWLITNFRYSMFTLQHPRSPLFIPVSTPNRRS